MNNNLKKLRVGVLGATGMVGQQYIKLLENHPWFDVTFVAASPNSAGKKYFEAVKSKWSMTVPIPFNVRDLIVQDANIVSNALGKCDFVFSALELDKEAIKKLEEEYAKNNIPVVSNCSANRFSIDVPMILPEINHLHLDMIPIQKKNHGFDKGFIIVKPNCSVQSYLTPIFALEAKGYKISKVILSTMQAVSGAGYPGVPSLDIVDNIIPFISGEEEKSEKEPLKIFGSIKNGKFVNASSIKFSAHCNRVPVIDGHTACVSFEFADKNNKPTKEEIIKIWNDFKSLPQELKLPSAPIQPIIYIQEENRPQPKKDRNLDKAMAVVVGRLRECNIFDYRFVGLSHNTVRGAAGGGILNAELLKAKGLL